MGYNSKFWTKKTPTMPGVVQATDTEGTESNRTYLKDFTAD